MSIADMKEYMNLCRQGEKSIPERKIILARTRERLQSQIDTIASYILVKTFHKEEKSFMKFIITCGGGG